MSEKEIDPRLQRNVENEEKAKLKGDYELHPIVDKLSKRLGSFNLIRNARNERQVKVSEIDELGG